MKLCRGEERHGSLQGLQGFSLLQNPPSFFLLKKHIFSFFLSFFLRLKGFLSLLLKCKSTALAVALHCTWHLSREKVGECQPGHEEPIWVLRVMEICVGSAFPREFRAACGWVPVWEHVDSQGLCEGRPGAASPAWCLPRVRET